MVRCLVLAAFACATALAAGPPREKIFPAYQQYDFANGLRLVAIPTDAPNVVALYVVVQTGSRNEVEPGKSGFAHLFEHMMFRGTPAYPPEKYEGVLKSAGAASNAYTTDDHTAYHTVFSKEDLETMVKVEADRFQHLSYPENILRTEALAVLGEYNKNSASPTSKLFEKLRETAFTRHTYQHTTMGFLKDIQAMPDQYEYSKQFFQRYYRPEYTTVIVAGDIDPAQTKALVQKYWGEWQRGSYKADIPAEPVQDAPRTAHVDWPAPTLPWLAIAFHGPAYDDNSREFAALRLIDQLAFGETSDLYQRLVIEQQKCDQLSASTQQAIDPYLVTIFARVKKTAEMESVQRDILATLDGLKKQPVSAERLDAVKRNLRYQFAMSMDNPQSVAGIAARFVALRRTPETVNRLYDTFQQVTPDDIRAAAQKYFIENGRTIVTLTGAKEK
jgi:zinc protease